jgi:hypothetical protein
MSADFSLRRIADELRAASCVAIVGAGASIGAGYPLTRSLPPHLWRAVDADPAALDLLAQTLGGDTESAKKLVGDSEATLRAAYAIVKQSPVAFRAFQESFQALDQVRASAFSPAHDVLAELLHRRIVEVVISLNWDTLLEAAYRRRYGRRLGVAGNWLYKPHGDVSDLTRPWALPNEPGVVPDALVAHVSSLAAERPRVLVIVGYSESDEVMVQRLIRPLESRWRVVRVGPSTSGEWGIPLPADDALSELRICLTGGSPEVPGWEYVPFRHMSDLGAALDGRGLGPSDVAACPRLPEVTLTKDVLRATHYATIEGAPGSGKSMVAYHAAYDMCSDGWEVLRLDESGRHELTTLASLDSLPTKTLAVVDDAQNLLPGMMRQLRERARPDLKVLFITNAKPADARAVVHISGEAAVRAIASDLRTRRADTLAAVKEFDPRVGEGWMDIRLEDLLNQAETASIPWQFNFILTAGERRARNHLANLAESDRADLLLATIAARQLATRDIGVGRDELTRFALVMGRDAAWVRDSLKSATQLRLVLGTKHLRCPHQRYAVEVLRIAFETRREPAWSQLVSMVRHVVLEGDPPLTGIAVLLRELWFADTFRAGWREETVVDDATWAHLTRRCLDAATPAEQGGAGYLLEALQGYHPAWSSWVEQHPSVFGRWITDATADSIWGIAMLLNELVQMPDVWRGVLGAVDRTAVAASVNAAPLSEAYAWARLLEYLAWDDDAWRNGLWTAIEQIRFRELGAATTPSDAHYVCAYAKGLSRYNYEYGLELIERLSATIALELSRDFPAGYRDFSTVWDDILGFVGLVLGVRKKLTPRQQAVMRGITKRINPVAAAESIMQGPRRSLTNSARMLAYVAEVDRRMAARIASHLNFDRLDHVTAGIWANPTRELIEFASSVAHAMRDYGQVAAWHARHEEEIEQVPARFVVLAPQLAIRVYERGGRINLGISSVMGWGLPTYVLHELASLSEATCRAVAFDHVEEMAKDFVIRQPDQCEHLNMFVALLQKLAPEALAKTFDALDPLVVRETWAARLRGKATERGAAATLVRAVPAMSRLHDIATELQKRYPSATRDAHRPLEGGAEIQKLREEV